MGKIDFDRCTLQTARLRLRPFQLDDAQRVETLLGDYDVSKTLARVPYPYTGEQVSAWLERVLDPGMTSEADFAIDAGDGVIGGVGLREVDDIAQLGFWLAKPKWGQGYMTEAASAALDWLFETTDHDVVASGAFEGNAASLRIQDKLGFEITETRMQHGLAQGKDMPHIHTLLYRHQFRPVAS